MSRSEVVIRPFERRDQEAARNLILDGLGEHFGFIDESLNPDLDDIWLHYCGRGDAFLVAQTGDELIGTGALVINEQGIGRIVRVSVGRSHRRKGIGSAIVKRLLALARTRGVGRILVETNTDWHDAICLYARLGFREYDRDEVSVHLQLDVR